MPTPAVLGRNGTYVVFRKLHTRGGGLPAVISARKPHPRGAGAPRRVDGRALAERRPRSRSPPSKTIPNSAETRTATTTSTTPTICAASHVLPARMRGVLEDDGVDRGHRNKRKLSMPEELVSISAETDHGRPSESRPRRQASSMPVCGSADAERLRDSHHVRDAGDVCSAVQWLEHSFPTDLSPRCLPEKPSGELTGP